MKRRLVIAVVICSTTACLFRTAWAQPPVSGINPANFSKTVSAKDDFYEHVNEGWLENNALPADQSNYGVFTLLNDQTQKRVRALIELAAEKADRAEGSDAQKVGDFFAAYTDVATRDKLGAEPIAEMLAEISVIDNKKDLAALLSRFSRKGISQPIGYYVSPDARDSSSYTIYFTQYGTSLPDRDYYLKDDAMYKKVREAFPGYITRLLSAVGYASSSSSAHAAERITKLETQLAEAQWSKVENRDPIKTYNKLSASAMAEILQHMHFEQFALITDCDMIDQYVVRQPSFFEALNELYESQSLQTWKDYLAFHVADSMAPVLSSDIEKIHFDFHSTVISGVSEQKPMWKRGVEATGSTLGELVGKLYVDEHFKPAAKRKMNQLVDNLKVAFERRIDSLDWMTPPTKRQAREKLAKFQTKIGYPDKWKDYSQLNIDSGDLVGNILRSAEVEHMREIDKLGGPIDRTEWHMTPQTINAYYNPVMNEIVFPAAILQPPFFNMEADDAVNYGGIGSVIGHELSHGFDDKGSKYDGDGNLRNWWNETDRNEFERRSKGLVQQYGAYRPFEDMAVNGELTLGENIGDLGGLNVAYTAFKMSDSGQQNREIDGLSADQRFFIGWAQVWPRHYREPELRRRLVVDPHSPSRYRVNGIVSNMDAFYEAFGVRLGDKMFIEREHRVRIW